MTEKEDSSFNKVNENAESISSGTDINKRKANVYRLIEDYSVASVILKCIKEFKIEDTTDEIVDPKGGESFLFHTTLENGESDWKADGYKWKNQSNYLFPQERPEMVVIYFCARNTVADSSKKSIFRKRASYIITSPLPVLIEYSGDSSSVIQEGHRNNKTNTLQSYSRTKPSIITNAYDKLQTNCLLSYI